MTRTFFGFALGALLALPAALSAQTIDERPGGPGEWGWRPGADEGVSRNPPPLSWRPQDRAAAYTLQLSRSRDFGSVEYQADRIEFNVHCPTSTLEGGAWFWRIRADLENGGHTEWSEPRGFEIPYGATEFPFISREQALERLPADHPRLFLRPEAVPEIRRRLADEAPDRWRAFLDRCDALLADPPPTDEPAKYEPGMVRGSDPWRAVWWGNRTYTIALLEGAASLGFAWQMTGDERYGEEARRLLMAAAEWDPKGATGYRYNDEAGMPYAYHFSRTYTFIHDLLSPQEREQCVRVMRTRGCEMYDHLCPGHLWKPYSSHSNRAWHFLGEVAIAFRGEIPEADDWLWFSLNVFANAYPVWSDADGGWHEGLNYWQSYIGRFTWWADVMREAVGIDAFDLPYFSQAGYYAMYMMPPGARDGGFGDLNARMTTERLRPLLTTLAAQSGNPHWRWYVDAIGGPDYPNDYPSLLRALRPVPDATPPTDLPTSRLFGGTGQAVLNSTLLGASDDVRIVFKSSPFGTQSHGYESQNAFLLYAYNEPLLIRTGYRDSYGSDHHRGWMWQSGSVNTVTVGGAGQTPHSQRAVGEIEAFRTSRHFDYVRGQAARAYGGRLNDFTREILFVKPDIVIVRDRLEAAEPSRFEWLLHAPEPFEVSGRDLRVASGGAGCVVRFLAPGDLEITQTDRFDPPPRERIQLVQHHLTARTREPARAAQFITVIRPHRAGEPAPPTGEEEHGIVHRLHFDVGAGRVSVTLSGPTLQARLEDTGGRLVAETDPEH